MPEVIEARRQALNKTIDQIPSNQNESTIKHSDPTSSNQASSTNDINNLNSNLNGINDTNNNSDNNIVNR